jgi:hypothetical protein
LLIGHVGSAGVMHDKGLGVAKDEAKAAKWFAAAAAQGIAPAQYNLGSLTDFVLIGAQRRSLLTADPCRYRL